MNQLTEITVRLKTINGNNRMYPDTLKDRENLHFHFPDLFLNKSYLTDEEIDAVVLPRFSEQGITLITWGTGDKGMKNPDTIAELSKIYQASHFYHCVDGYIGFKKDRLFYWYFRTSNGYELRGITRTKNNATRYKVNA